MWINKTIKMNAEVGRLWFRGWLLKKLAWVLGFPIFKKDTLA